MQQGIISESFEELIKEMNEFEKSNDVFASQIHPVITDRLRWYGIIFYKGNVSITQKQEKVAQNGSNQAIDTSQNKPTPKKSITKGQKNFLEINKKELKEQGFKVDVQTSKEAWEVISEFKKKNNLNGSEI